MVRDCFHLDENASQEEINHVMASTYCNPKGEQNNIQQLDYKMKETLNKFNEKINRFVPSHIKILFISNRGSSDNSLLFF